MARIKHRGINHLLKCKDGIHFFNSASAEIHHNVLSVVQQENMSGVMVQFLLCILTFRLQKLLFIQLYLISNVNKTICNCGRLHTVSVIAIVKKNCAKCPVTCFVILSPSETIYK